MQTRLLTLLLLLNGCFYVTANEHAGRWDIDGDGVERPKDCNDRDKDVQDLSWYEDLDGDGFGDPDTAVSNCDAPPGTVDNGDDCDDGDELVNPSRAELCNGIDDDCDDQTGEDSLESTFCDDQDGDGFGDPDTAVSACGAVGTQIEDCGDCDDEDPEVSPDADDICDAVDNDCDGEADNDSAFWYQWYIDGDGDGFGDQSLPTVLGCSGGSGDVMGDLDFDPATDDVFDCDDIDPFVNPDGVELCDGIDNDCDGSTDLGAIDATLWWEDNDGDGFGVTGTEIPLCTCEPINGCYRIDNALDCDDTNPDKNPQEVEICANGINEDCDADTDEPEPDCINCETADTGC